MLKRTASAALSLALAAGIAATAVAADVHSGRDAASATVVDTDRGAVRGAERKEVRTFQGIPYAAAPTGGRRWAAPAPAAKWSGTRDARKPGAACPQSGLTPPAGPKSDTEDCLFLNVTAPRAKSAAPRPVMVYLHGGDHTDGDGAMHGADRLSARGDVLVVTVNYRLGALGYLAHPALEKAAGRGESGNYGFLDQQAALRWVQRNAAAFGGDPDNVTLFGQSAGAYSACAHLVAPSSAGLFDRVVLQSASCTSEKNTRTRAQALRAGELTAARLEKEKGLKDWRAAGPGQWVNPIGQGPQYGPVYGGKLLPRTPQEAFAVGAFHKVPVLQGINGEEGLAASYSAELMKRAATRNPAARLGADDYRARLREEFGDRQAAAVAARYPLSAYRGSPALALGAVLTDSDLGRLTIESNRALAGRTRTYTYSFDEQDTPWYKDEAAYPKPSFPMGAAHTFELPYLFELSAMAPLDDEQKVLSEKLIRTWSGFARTGTVDWAPGSQASPHAQAFGSGPGGVRPVDLEQEHRYDFWKSLAGARP